MEGPGCDQADRLADPMAREHTAASQGREHAGGRRASELEFARIVAFSDGVMAIAITLLVLNIEVPNLPGNRTDELTSELVDLGPTLLAYALSFAVIGRFWMLHHRFFGTLSGFDSGLIALNLLYLSFVVLVPFTTDLVDGYSTEPAAPITYATNLGCAALINWSMMRYAISRQLVEAASRPEVLPWSGWQGLVVPGIFALSIPVALLSPVAAELMWLGVFMPHAQAGARRRLSTSRGAGQRSA